MLIDCALAGNILCMHTTWCSFAVFKQGHHSKREGSETFRIVQYIFLYFSILYPLTEVKLHMLLNVTKHNIALILNNPVTPLVCWVFIILQKNIFLAVYLLQITSLRIQHKSLPALRFLSSVGFCLHYATWPLFWVLVGSLLLSCQSIAFQMCAPLVCLASN